MFFRRTKVEPGWNQNDKTEPGFTRLKRGCRPTPERKWNQTFTAWFHTS